MSVLIKGMEMPTEEQSVITINIYSDGVVTCYDDDVERKAFPVSAHGRLIESKAFLQVVHDTGNFSLDELAHLAVLVAATPTIIPAEEAQP